MKTGIEIIAKERQRQESQEGWSPTHDDAHKKGEMAGAAACYALSACCFLNPQQVEAYREGVTHKVRIWPWENSWWKPKDKVRDLARAGALIAAEIDRLQRLTKKQ